MAKGRYSALFAYLRGRIGDIILRHHKDGTTSTARRPKRSAIPRTASQLVNNDRFGDAVAWMSEMLKEPEVRAHYAALAKRKGKRICDLLKSDFMTPPRVEHVDVSEYSGAPGDVLKIKAWDNVKVTDVGVRLLLENDEVLEEGEAVEKFRRWTYTTSRPAPAGTTIRILATAMDRPGGSHTLEAHATV